MAKTNFQTLSLYASHDRLHLSHDVQFRSMPRTDMSVSFGSVLPLLCLPFAHSFSLFVHLSHFGFVFLAIFTSLSLSPLSFHLPEEQSPVSFVFPFILFLVQLIHSFLQSFSRLFRCEICFQIVGNVQVVTSLSAQRIIILKLMKWSEFRECTVKMVGAFVRVLSEKQTNLYSISLRLYRYFVPQMR